MRALILFIACGFMAGCLSAPREREAHCLGAMMADTWQAEHELESAEQEWRSALQGRADHTLASRHSPHLSAVIADWYSSSVPAVPAALRSNGAGDRVKGTEEDQALYERVVAAQARYRASKEWYGRVARRVQTRMEEDNMLYPVLGTLATSTAIVLYPLVRWNVRSVLWEGADPDADDDPVQVFCTARLRQDVSGTRP